MTSMTGGPVPFESLAYLFLIRFISLLGLRHSAEIEDYCWNTQVVTISPLPTVLLFFWIIWVIANLEEYMGDKFG